MRGRCANTGAAAVVPFLNAIKGSVGDDGDGCSIMMEANRRGWAAGCGLEVGTSSRMQGRLHSDAPSQASLRREALPLLLAACRGRAQRHFAMAMDHGIRCGLDEDGRAMSGQPRASVTNSLRYHCYLPGTQ